MAQANVLQDGIDRFQGAVKEIDKRYKQLQKQADKRRKAFEKNAEQRVKRIRTELRKNPVLKRAEDMREEAASQFEERYDQMLQLFRVATQSEVQRLERKVAQLNRKVRELERA